MGRVVGRTAVRSLAAAFVVLASGWLVSCAATTGSAPAAGGVPFRSLKIGSADLPAGDRVLRSQEDLAAVWSDAGLRGQPPELDFSESMVLLSARGCLPNACYRTRILSFTRNGAGGEAWVEDVNPKPDCICSLVMTCPFHLAVVSRVEGQVSFHHRPKHADCTPRRRP